MRGRVNQEQGRLPCWNEVSMELFVQASLMAEMVTALELRKAFESDFDAYPRAYEINFHGLLPSRFHKSQFKH
jgi:hypothetical protein